VFDEIDPGENYKRGFFEVNIFHILPVYNGRHSG
jgi:hypothetical protein